MLELAAIHGGRPEDPNKRTRSNFVLWQPSLRGRAGLGMRPGARGDRAGTSMSAIALRDLGVTLDVHGGGRDLAFPHHECEAAQSESVSGAPFVRHWMHVGLVGSTAPRCPSPSATWSSSTSCPARRGGRGAIGAARPPLPPRLGVAR